MWYAFLYFIFLCNFFPFVSIHPHFGKYNIIYIIHIKIRWKSCLPTVSRGRSVSCPWQTSLGENSPPGSKAHHPLPVLPQWLFEVRTQAADLRMSKHRTGTLSWAVFRALNGVCQSISRPACDVFHQLKACAFATSTREIKLPWAGPERASVMPEVSKMKKPDVKIVLLGDMNVGKTSLLHRYMERKFKDTVSTVGGAFFLKQWGPYNISIWDTAGNPSFTLLSFTNVYSRVLLPLFTWWRVISSPERIVLTWCDLSVCAGSLSRNYPLTLHFIDVFKYL